MDQTIFISDALRYFHLLSVVVAMGVAFHADFSLLRRLHLPITQRVIDNFSYQYRMASFFFFMVWLSGGLVLYMKGGFALSALDTAMVSKLMVVTILSANALIAGALILPIMRKNRQYRFLDLSVSNKIFLAVSVGITTTSWLLALAIAQSQFLAAAPPEVMQQVLSISYTAAVVVPVIAAVIIHYLTRSPDTEAPYGLLEKEDPFLRRFNQSRPVGLGKTNWAQGWFL